MLRPSPHPLVLAPLKEGTETRDRLASHKGPLLTEFKMMWPPPSVHVPVPAVFIWREALPFPSPPATLPPAATPKTRDSYFRRQKQ